MASFTVVYDACVLYPAPLRDLLLRIAVSGVVRARWSTPILDEMTKSILAKRKDLDPAAFARTRDLMCEAVPDCLVTGFEKLAPGIILPDTNDAHVVAAPSVRGLRQSSLSISRISPITIWKRGTSRRNTPTNS